MLRGIRQQTVVREGGKIEIISPELRIGINVEVFVWIEPAEQDTTEYLLSTDANREHLLQALKDWDDRATYIYADIDKL